MEARTQEILRHWFGPIGDGWTVPPDRLEMWFGKDPKVDEELRVRFGEDAGAAAAGRLDGWADDPAGRLALVLLLDQLPRHLHRGRPGAFAQDAAALRLAREGVDRGDDRALHPIERSFLYLPYQHAEELAAQEESVALYAKLRDEAPAAVRPSYESFWDYAERHRVIIARFGRFPHRNAILGRPSSPEEEAFLLEPNSSF